MAPRTSFGTGQGWRRAAFVVECSVFGIDRSLNVFDDGWVVLGLDGDGADVLREAVASIGVGVETLSPGPGHGADLVLVNPAGGRILVEVKRQALASTDGLPRRIAQWNRQLSGDAAVRVVVADRVTSEAREMLRAAGWGWLDLRGHLHIAAPGLFIDTDVAALRDPPGRSAPLAGRAGLEVAAALLLAPEAPIGVRQLASELNRAPSTVSEVLSSMTTEGLIDEQRRPAVPELFWALAARWRPSQVDVASIPAPGNRAVTDALKLGLDDIADTVGWALTDSVAASIYGAPVSIRSDHPRDFYVPDQATSRRAVHLLAAARDHDSRAATVRVAPVPMICSRRIDAARWANEEWPLAQPLFVALDLAQDPGRGREILNSWTPNEPWQRVW
jgi:hypothetical protein